MFNSLLHFLFLLLFLYVPLHYLQLLFLQLPSLQLLLVLVHDS